MFLLQTILSPREYTAGYDARCEHNLTIALSPGLLSVIRCSSIHRTPMLPMLISVRQKSVPELDGTTVSDFTVSSFHRVHVVAARVFDFEHGRRWTDRVRN